MEHPSYLKLNIVCVNTIIVLSLLNSIPKSRWKQKLKALTKKTGCVDLLQLIKAKCRFVASLNLIKISNGKIILYCFQ